jgi:hypothetical protein
LKENVSAFSIPVGFYMDEKLSEAPLIQLMPSFHFTYGKSRYFDFTFSPKALFFISGNGVSYIPLINLTAGFGLSSNLKKWAVRPEFGYTISPYSSSGILQTAVGLSLTLGN